MPSGSLLLQLGVSITKAGSLVEGGWEGEPGQEGGKQGFCPSRSAAPHSTHSTLHRVE